LDTLRQLVVEGKLDARNEPTFVLPPENASMPARLMQVSLRTHSSGWRMSMPECVKLFLPQDYSPDDWSMILSVEGFWKSGTPGHCEKPFGSATARKAAIAAMR